jgi:hypothetical protein
MMISNKAENLRSKWAMILDVLVPRDCTIEGRGEFLPGNLVGISTEVLVGISTPCLLV